MKRSRFGDGGSVDDVVLVGFDIRLHELGRDDADGVPTFLEFACQPLRTGTRFHADGRPFGALNELQHGVAAEFYLLDRLAVGIYADLAGKFATAFDFEFGGSADTEQTRNLLAQAPPIIGK